MRTTSFFSALNAVSVVSVISVISVISGGGLSGCTLVADLDRFESADDQAQDFEFTIERFTPHLTHKVFFEIVELETNQLASVAIIEPLGTPDATIRLPNGIPQDPHAFQFWADNDRNGIVNTLSGSGGADHSWRMEDVRDLAVRSRPGSECDAMIPTEQPTCFTHVTPFDVLDMPTTPATDFNVTVSLLTETTSFVEIHLVEVDAVLGTRSVVAMYHLRQVPDPVPPETTTEVTLTIPGVARPGRLYDLDTFVDLNGDGIIPDMPGAGEGEVWVQSNIDGADLAGATRPVVADPDEAAGRSPDEGLLFVDDEL